MSLRARAPFLSFFFAYYAARGISGFILPLYFVSVGIPIVQVGIALSVSGVSVLVFELIWGLVIDRVGTQRILPFVVALTALSYVICPLVKTGESAIAVEFLLGVSGPAITVAIRASLVEGSRSSQWAGGFGLLGSVASASFMTGSLLGSGSVYLTGFTSSFYLSAILAVIAYAGYFLWGRRAGPGTMTPPGPAISRGEAAPPRVRLDVLGLSLLGLVAVPMMMAFSFFTSLVQLVVTRTPSIASSTFQASLVIAAFYLSTAILQPLFASRGATDAKRWIAIGLLANFAIFAVLTKAHDIWEIALLAFLGGACYSAISPLSLSLIMVNIPKRYVGRVMGIYGAAEDIGFIIGPLVGSLIWIEFSLSWAYLAFGFAFLVVLAPFLFLTLKASNRAKR